MNINGNEILRVFPRRTRATPDDPLTFTSAPTRAVLNAGGFDEVHVSVTFSYDVPKAEMLAKKWEKAGVPVRVGGPAYGDRMSPMFTPGLYLKKGYTFTSRGCPNHCGFCEVQKVAHGKVIELPITDGWNVLDDNLLATSPEHFRSVMAMLKRQPERPIFTGGLETAILKPWQAELIKSVGTKRLYCAYDTPDDYEPLVQAGRIFQDVGFTKTSHALCCYVLIGYRGDTFEKAEKRLIDTAKAGFMPYAMLYRDKSGETEETWRAFQTVWCCPTVVAAKVREIWKEDERISTHNTTKGANEIER